MTKKYVYTFGNGKAEGKADMKNILGGKGANLAEMNLLGFPVPAGFTISTEVCTYFYEHQKKYPPELKDQVLKALSAVEKVMGASFGDPKNPLLVSVRSGARASMPGMMDTILNLGLNEATLQGLIQKTRNARFAYDSYRRFIQMYGDVVLGVSSALFEESIDALKKKRGIKLDTEFTAEDLKALAEEFKRLVVQETAQPFPENPQDQLWGGIGAVFSSWQTPRAIEYRRLSQIPEEWGTAVNVQAMVYGNMGDDSATGVAFTRDPSTGEKKFYGEYLINAQGEDVVAGVRTPQPLTKEAKKEKDEVSLEEAMSKIYQELVSIYQRLEKHYRDMQDIEFTIQQGKLWMLQTRNGKRTAAAAIKIAVEMTNEKLITKKESIMRVQPSQLDQLLHPRIDPKVKREVLAKGLPASPGAATGKVVFSAEEAEKWDHRGEKVLLVRIETSPDDIKGMAIAKGILTSRGGMTSHAAVVARGMGKTCVAGCGALAIDYAKKQFMVGNVTVKEGDFLTIDGSTGEVMLGALPTVEPELSSEFEVFMKWVDEYRKLGVRANADTPHDAEVARRFGAAGIGLCRTEHMFFEGDRIDAVREMILANDLEGRQRALMKILPMQREDFKGIFQEMDGFPVTIRLLDPPLHEFLPHTDQEIEELSRAIDIPAEKLKRKSEELREFNPMLGHRGCRLGVTFPEIYAMQVQAIIEAACDVTKKGIKAISEIEIPLVSHPNEMRVLRTICEEKAKEVIAKTKQKVPYTIGTMIELPRACLCADELAYHADFFSFGTNDLTQTTFGFSRDDSAKFLEEYVNRHILPHDPFVSIDQEGVGRLMKLAVDLGRKTKSNLEIGICGEHGGDPDSIAFCARLGLNYVSCSPYRVPIARLAAAQAALKVKES
ncbi:MAG: pyruvate, phosphate dikinase [Deltaproteobacteria bacterium RIFCSPLOWO2_02_FULL_44_10]|nr:MAG: pyruvate, phosphate dikinase [Deltaproteobacteria bacterium RIFCSPHIGHO2_02_FULL_44_16]OGQ45226.1 MAG: pyruvate, phosphate dikinase [Deltaproteobacteria bacterium RIFCSPLOWO2_02_FULL_44_10]